MEADEVKAKMREAVQLSHKFADLVTEEDDPRVIFMASIMLAAGTATAIGMSLHDTMASMMAMYKDAEKYRNEESK